MTGLALLDAPFAHHGSGAQWFDTTGFADAPDVVAVVADVSGDLARLERSSREDLDNLVTRSPTAVLQLPLESFPFGAEFLERSGRRLLLFLGGHDRIIPRQVVTRGDMGVSPVTETIPSCLLPMPHHVAMIVGVMEISQTEGYR